MIYVGVDPGLKGGVAVIDDPGEVFVSVMPLAGKSIAIKEIVLFIWGEWTAQSQNLPILFVIERAQSMPKQGVVSTGNYLRDYGKLLGMCEAMGWPYLNPRPQEWKNAILKGTKKDKNAAIEYVRTRYPQLDLKPGRMRVVHDGICDAVCLAEYGRIKGEK